jgi:hypothetical protein
MARSIDDFPAALSSVRTTKFGKFSILNFFKPLNYLFLKSEFSFFTKNAFLTKNGSEQYESGYEIYFSRSGMCQVSFM